MKEKYPFALVKGALCRNRSGVAPASDLSGNLTPQAYGQKAKGVIPKWPKIIHMLV